VGSQIEQIAILSGVTPKIALVDRGYRGVEPVTDTRLLVSRKRGLIALLPGGEQVSTIA